METTAVASGVGKAVRALPWSLNDLLAYLLIGTVVFAVALISLHGAGPVLNVAQTQPWLSAIVAVLVGYPGGYLVYSVGRLLREGFLRLRKPPPPLPSQLDFLGLEESEAIYALIVPSAPVKKTVTVGHARSAALLAEKHLPDAHSKLNRQYSFFAFQISLMGALFVIAILAGGGWLLREMGNVQGPSAAFLVVALVSLALLAPLEYLAREQNRAVFRQYFDFALAVAAVVEHERGKPME